MPKLLIKYVRNYKKHRLAGVIVAACLNNRIILGWSKCAYSLGDKFDKQTAIELAVARINKGAQYEQFDRVPRELCDEWCRMYERAQRYFKVSQ